MALSIANGPIGIFDSGVGGLTVAKAVNELLPNEQIIYFGDTAHAPWGDKSAKAITGYATSICELLLTHKCKVIIVACNSASAVALDAINKYIANKTPLLNVITPTIEYLAHNYQSQTIGLIGTKQTINSKIYQQQLAKYNIKVNAIATPLLVPIIEEDLIKHEILNLAIKEYLQQPALRNISALVLGCTHYPLIKPAINNYYNNTIEIIDSAAITAQHLYKDLQDNNLLAENTTKLDNIFYVSDYTDYFTKAANLFFGKQIPQLQAIDPLS